MIALLRRHRRAGTSSIRTPNFRGNILHVVDRNEPEPPRGRRAAGRSCSSGARSGCGPASTTRCCSAGTRCSSPRSPKPRPRSTATTGWTRRATNAAFLLRELRARRRPASAARGGRRTSRTPRTTPRCSKRCCTLAELDDVAWLADARVVADELLRLFLDADGGGFFTTGHDAEPLVVRPKDVFDDATPSANSLAANGLLRLARSPATTATTRRPSRSSRCSPARWRRTRPASRTCSARSSVTCARRSRS